MKHVNLNLSLGDGIKNAILVATPREKERFKEYRLENVFILVTYKPTKENFEKISINKEFEVSIIENKIFLFENKSENKDASILNIICFADRLLSYREKINVYFCDSLADEASEYTGLPTNVKFLYSLAYRPTSEEVSKKTEELK